MKGDENRLAHFHDDPQPCERCRLIRTKGVVCKRCYKAMLKQIRDARAVLEALVANG